MRGWHRPATIADLSAQLTASLVARDLDVFPWPWTPPETSAAEPADPEEVAAGLAQLDAEVRIGGGDV